jgi:hypothetical protein
MSFGGSVAGMITSLKNNARGKRVKKFDKKESLKYNISLKKLLKKKATPGQLNDIKAKLEIENKKNRIKTLVILLSTFIILILSYLIIQKIWFDSH